ncbi:hypothetical protein [Paenibacillus pini]|uniref:Uncharacterized protein n=1 Tax=Paenibacillus pini JCM 16418 TaxID=1236976 RepID=W7YC82_9BACL|nr:hypothetical protein [Paenibacillus pini]GAF08530.1 hypothetical protein JCM16418_2612 [Paenibacillus pini JCM 16418]
MELNTKDTRLQDAQQLQATALTRIEDTPIMEETLEAAEHIVEASLPDKTGGYSRPHPIRLLDFFYMYIIPVLLLILMLIGFFR